MEGTEEMSVDARIFRDCFVLYTPTGERLLSG